MKNAFLRGAGAGVGSFLLLGLQAPLALSNEAAAYADPAYPAAGQPSPQSYPPGGYGVQDYTAPGFSADAYQDPGYPAGPAYAAPQYPVPGYADPAYPVPAYPDPAYAGADPAATGYAGQVYADPAYPAQNYPAQGSADPGYPMPGYADPTYPAPGYVDPYAAQYGYADPTYGQPMMAYPGYPQPYTGAPAAEFSMDPQRARALRDGFPMAPPGWTRDDWFGGGNPFHNPADTRGYWADPDFRPWSTGPFGPEEWDDVHPMSNMPWGNFPGWGDGFFGGFGPQSWKGVTPWGNDVPFRWIDPTDPRSSIGDIWDDALNTPNTLGRMPPGWTAPYISVPNPIDVEEEFERNARNFPDEMRKAINTGESDWGGTAQPKPRQAQPKDASKPQEQAATKAPEEDSWVKPMKPIRPYSGRYRDAQ